MNYDIVVVFQMAVRLRKESGLLYHERQALKRIYLGSDRETRFEIQRQFGTQFIEEVLV